MCNIDRAWMFQTCTEFGYYQTSSQKVNKIWGNSRIVDFYIQQCEDIYTPRYGIYIEDPLFEWHISILLLLLFSFTQNISFL